MVMMVMHLSWIIIHRESQSGPIMVDGTHQQSSIEIGDINHGTVACLYLSEYGDATIFLWVYDKGSNIGCPASGIWDTQAIERNDN